MATGYCVKRSSASSPELCSYSSSGIPFTYESEEEDGVIWSWCRPFLQRITTLVGRDYWIKGPKGNYTTGDCTVIAGTSIDGNIYPFTYHTVSASAAQNGSVSWSVPSTPYSAKIDNNTRYVYGSRSVTLTAVPNDGYVFRYWSDGNTKAERKVTSETSLTAYFAPLRHTVNVSVSQTSAGTGSVSIYINGVKKNSGVVVQNGDEVRILCEPDSNHVFQSWSINGVTSSTSDKSFIVSMDDSETINCVAFLVEKSKYNVRISKADGARGTISLTDGKTTWTESAGVVSAQCYSGVRYTLTSVVTSEKSSTGRELNKLSGITKNGTALPYSAGADGMTYVSTFVNGNGLSSETLQDVNIVVTFAQKQLWHAELGIPLQTGGTAEIQPAPDVTTAYGSHPAPYDRWLEGAIVVVATPAAGHIVGDFNSIDIDGGSHGSSVDNPNPSKDGKYRLPMNLDYNARIFVNFMPLPCRVFVRVDSKSTFPDGRKAGSASVESMAQGHSIETLVYGDEVAYIATQNDGYQFGGWYLESGEPAPKSVVTKSGASHEYEYTDPEYHTILTGNLSLVAKFKALVTVSASRSESASGNVSIDATSSAESVSKWITLGDTCHIVAQAEGADTYFGSWFDISDTEFERPLDLSADETVEVADTMSIVARFVSSEDALYIAMGNFDLDLEPGSDSSPDIGALTALTSGSSPVEIKRCTESEFLAGTGMSRIPYGATRFYILGSASRITIKASPLTGLGFGRWTRQTIRNGSPSSEISLSVDSSFSTVANQHYFYKAYWGDPKPVLVTSRYADGSDITCGNVYITGLEIADKTIENKKTDDSGVSATYTQGDVIMLSTDIKNGYVFYGWYYDEGCSIPVVDSAVGGVVYRHTDSVYVTEVVSAIGYFAKFVKDVSKLYKWEGSDERKLAVWRSKTMVANKPFDAAVVRADADGYSGGGGDMLVVNVLQFSSPDTEDSAKTSKSVSLNSQNSRRLARSRPERYMQIEVRSNRSVNAVIVGTSAEGIAV